MNKNIFGEPLITCSKSPLTGFFRNGCCDTDDSDLGMHTVCVVVDDEFLLDVLITQFSDDFNIIRTIKSEKINISSLTWKVVNPKILENNIMSISDEMGCIRHRFHATSNDNFCLSCHDVTSCDHRCFQT